MEKIETLKDGTKVTIKELKPENLDQLMQFYLELPRLTPKGSCGRFPSA